MPGIVQFLAFLAVIGVRVLDALINAAPVRGTGNRANQLRPADIDFLRRHTPASDVWQSMTWQVSADPKHLWPSPLLKACRSGEAPASQWVADAHALLGPMRARYAASNDDEVLTADEQRALDVLANELRVATADPAREKAHAQRIIEEQQTLIRHAQRSDSAVRAFLEARQARTNPDDGQQ